MDVLDDSGGNISRKHYRGGGGYRAVCRRVEETVGRKGKPPRTRKRTLAAVGHRETVSTALGDFPGNCGALNCFSDASGHGGTALQISDLEWRQGGMDFG